MDLIALTTELQRLAAFYGARFATDDEQLRAKAREYARVLTHLDGPLLHRVASQAMARDPHFPTPGKLLDYATDLLVQDRRYTGPGSTVLPSGVCPLCQTELQVRTWPRPPRHREEPPPDAAGWVWSRQLLCDHNWAIHLRAPYLTDAQLAALDPGDDPFVADELRRRAVVVTPHVFPSAPCPVVPTPLPERTPF